MERALTPTERWSALVEFWDVRIRRAETDAERERFQREAAQAWTCLDFYRRRADAGFDVVDGKVAKRSLVDWEPAA